MKKLPKTLLIISAVAFAISLTEPGASFASGVLKPLGAVCFIVFFITNLLAKEMDEFDKDHNPKSPASKKNQFREERNTGTSSRSSTLIPAGAK